MGLTDHPDNRIPFVKPEHYEELDYELLFRNYEAGFQGIPWHNAGMPNRKTDVNNNTGFSTDYIGMNYEYPEGDYEIRQTIVRKHLDYQRGLMWTLAYHPRIPESVRKEVSRWGLCKDEFEQGGGWQEQLYIREARRMVGAKVMTQHHCQGREVVDDPVGMAAYTMDSHNVQRYMDATGQVRNEGDVQVGGFPPYPISYQSLVPKAQECANLLVPVCLSSTHIAFGSIRMEPVFMVLGQSAATAAVQAIQEGMSVQMIDYNALQKRLLADGQVLRWDGPAGRVVHGLDAGTLSGVVVDETKAEVNGLWVKSTSTQGFFGLQYLHDGHEGKGEKTVRYEMSVPQAGVYEVRISYSAHANRASNVPVIIRHADGESTVKVNQRRPGRAGPGMESLGTWRFTKEQPATVTISNAGTDGYVIADVVQLLPVK